MFRTPKPKIRFESTGRNVSETPYIARGEKLISLVRDYKNLKKELTEIEKYKCDLNEKYYNERHEELIYRSNKLKRKLESLGILEKVKLDITNNYKR